MSTSLAKILAVSVGLSTLAFAATCAQAAVVCNADGECWHTREVYEYPPAAGIVIQPDNFAWEGDRYRWREHEGRGYWHGHNWTVF